MSILLPNQLKCYGKIVFLFVLFASYIQSVFAQDLIAEIIPSKDIYTTNDTVVLALKIKIPEKYHLYGNPLGPGIGKALQFSINDSGSIKWQTVKKPEAGKFSPPIGEWVWAYENQQVFFIKGNVTRDTNSEVNGFVRIEGLICNTDCIPVKKDFNFSFELKKEINSQQHFQNNPELLRLIRNSTDSITVSVIDSSFSNNSITGIDLSEFSIKQPVLNIAKQWNYSPLEKKIQYNISLAILLGFLAGIIMNFMPCVLPVLGIKIISFSEAREKSRSMAILKSLVFSGGMLSVFMLLASFASFANFSWGQQFQNPRVLIMIIGIIVIFALGMFDVFMIMVPSSLSSIGKTRKSGLVGDFINGMFATILATPCSGPLLGATLAWTLTQKSTVIFAIFLSIGLGMAFPYIVFSTSTRLSKLIPKPGKWMNDFKYMMGFFLLGFAVYLMIGLPKDMVISTIGLCLVLAFSVIFFARYAPFGSSVLKKSIIAAIALAIVGGGIYLNFGILYKMISSENKQSAVEGNGEWKEFSADLLKNAHDNGQNVMVDFTANWCVNCQFNKITVLNAAKVNELIKEKNIVAIKADLTRPNPQIESLLHHLGSRSVPFLAVFSGDKPYEPVIMRDILNKRSLIDVLEKLENSQ